MNSPRRTGLMSIDARVCLNPSSLCVRIQNITVSNRQDLKPLFRWSYDRIDFRHRDDIAVCGHVDPTSTIKSLTSKYGQKSEAGDIQLYSQGKCNRCKTSWNIELREIEEQDICLIFTQWKDLGPGLDPEDDRWKTHQTRYHRTLKASEMLDDPRLRFEMLSEGCNSPEALSMEGMFRRNMSLLRRQRYRAVMQYSRYWGGYWYLQGKEQHTSKLQCTII